VEWLVSKVHEVSRVVIGWPKIGVSETKRGGAIVLGKSKEQNAEFFISRL